MTTLFPLPPRNGRPRNPHFDALEDVFGPTSTKGERSLYGMVAAHLREAGASPDDIRMRGQVLLSKGWRDPTPKALDNHWSALAPAEVDAVDEQFVGPAELVRCGLCGKLSFDCSCTSL